MSWERESLFTNVTREPGDTVIELGLTPLDVIVIVVVAEGVPPPGEVGVLPPPPLPQAEKEVATRVARMPWRK
jgi:hypothetical protein